MMDFKGVFYLFKSGIPSHEKAIKIVQNKTKIVSGLWILSIFNFLLGTILYSFFQGVLLAVGGFYLIFSIVFLVNSVLQYLSYSTQYKNLLFYRNFQKKSYTQQLTSLIGTFENGEGVTINARLKEDFLYWHQHDEEDILGERLELAFDTLFTSILNENHQCFSIGIGEQLKILELPQTVRDKETIKKQYKNLVKKYHPDINQNGAQRFKEIQKAYEEILVIL